MKKIAWLMIFTAGTVFGGLTRQITETRDIASATQISQPITWFCGESVDYRLISTYNSVPYKELTNAGSFTVWTVMPQNDYSNAYFSVTGMIVSATNGESLYHIAPEQAVLPDGYYDGYVQAYQLGGAVVSNLAILAKQLVRVKGSPAGLAFNYLPVQSNAIAVLQAAVMAITNNLIVFQEDVVAITTNAVTKIALNGVTNSAVSGLADLGAIIPSDTNGVTKIALNGVTNGAVSGLADLGTIIPNDTNGVTKIALNGVTNTAPAGTGIVNLGTINTGSVFKIVINSVTNTPISGTVDLGAINGATSVTNVSINANAGVVEVYRETYSSPTTNGFEVYNASKVSADGIYLPVTGRYENANGSICTLTEWGTWSIFKGITELFWQDNSGYLPWDSDGGWSGGTLSFRGTAVKDTINLTNVVTKIVLNGVTNTPISGTVDLGAIISGVTNVQITAPNDVVVTGAGSYSFSVTTAGSSVVIGDYYRVGGIGKTAWYTNASAAKCTNSTYWSIDGGSSVVYYDTSMSSTNTNPVSVSAWTVYMSAVAPAPTLVAAPAPSSVSLFNLRGGLTTNFTFLCSEAVTGRVWFSCGVLTNVDLNIGE